MQSKFQFLFVAAIIVLFASCKKSNTQGRYIPSNASIAILIDGDAISKKLPWATVKNSPAFKQLNADSSLPETLKKLLDDPETSGIDTKKDLVFFVQKDSLGSYIAFEGTLKDEATFRSFNNSFPEKGSSLEADGISFISRMPVCVGWNKEKFVYVFDAPQVGERRRSYIDDTTSLANILKPRDIGATCKSVFTLKESSSLGEEEKFTTLMKETGDIHFWMNTEELSKSANTSPLTMISLDKFTKGNITTAAVTFNDGKINISTLSYSGEDLTKIFKKYSGGKVDDEMLKRIPGNDVIAAMALNFKPEGLKELLQVLGVDGIVNVGLTKMGTSINDFVKGSKGDIALGLTDFKLVTDTFSAGSGEGSFTKPTFNFVFATSIGEKESFNKLITAGKTLLGPGGSSGFVYSMNDKYFVLGGSKDQADKYIAGNNNNPEWISKINGEPFGAYINFQAAIKSFDQQAVKDSAAKIAYDASLQFWDNLLWKGGTFRDGGLAQSIEINLKDKTVNSLVQLNSYAAKLSEARVIQVKKQKEDFMAYQDAVIPSESKIKTDGAAAIKPKTK